MTASGTKTPEVLAVFDLGKTNSKLFVFSADGEVVGEARTRPVWKDEGGLRVLDDEHLFAWMEASLSAAAVEHGVNRIMFSGHGCTFALTQGASLAHPVLDYEQEPPAEVSERIDTVIPDFDETFSPRLPLGFNYGRHILWLEDRDGSVLEKADSILGYPQFWSWKFSGRKVSEVSYLGCHSHLWAPLNDDFSSLVDNRGWRGKMPEFARAGAALGQHTVLLADGSQTQVTVHNGVHDSNASLYYYRSLGFDDFTLISTGTWVIIFNSQCPLEALDRDRDMLANVTVDHQPAATIRFMGGREYDAASDGWNRPISTAAIAAVVAKSIFALPSFAPGGPIPHMAGRFVGPEAEGEERAAAALLYVVLMTDLSLDLIRSKNPIVIDGGLVKTGLYAELLAALRPGQPILTSANAEGSAFGAAALAFEEIGIKPFENQCQPVAPVSIEGLAAYRAAWQQLANAREGVTGDGRAEQRRANR
ncbi:carbohydrate kinase [Sinorhizobium sp. BG8]|uniref:FGGY-family carbohydrate kinase n=1 Tax=Sinorhizobium sp. BG8 TaxID=2613773 RepID=UPI00193DEFFE|nr:carbohydrate kinase [Sinorhizobium sp. BG8]QRM57377.1 carbohydrate kinase [Sinorhizobium sp. BG8]